MGKSQKLPDAKTPKAFHIIIKPRASNELSRAYYWYEDCSPGLGERFKRAFDVSLKWVKTHPTRYAVVYKNVRSLVMKAFPYKIFYRITGSEVKILTVIHTARSDSRWKRQLDRDK